MAGFDEADVVLAIGYDLVEHSPEHWNPKRDKRIICIDSVPAETDELLHARGGARRRHLPHPHPPGRGVPARARTTVARRDCASVVLGRFEAAKDDDAFPMQPPRALWEIRQALGREDILISDVGLHKLWIGRMFPRLRAQHGADRQRPRRDGLRACPAAIAAKLVHPDRNVVTVNGDGGFLMNCQELETAVRLGTPFVNVIWENAQYGSIVWKQDKKFGSHFGTDFTNPDFVKLAEGFGMPALALRVAPTSFGERLRHALTLDAAVADRAADRLLASTWRSARN